MLCIMINVVCNNKLGIIGGIVVLFIIILLILSGEIILYVFVCIFEIFCGVFIVMMVNIDIEIFWKKLKNNKL